MQDKKYNVAAFLISIVIIITDVAADFERTQHVLSSVTEPEVRLACRLPHAPRKTMKLDAIMPPAAAKSFFTLLLCYSMHFPQVWAKLGHRLTVDLPLVPAKNLASRRHPISTNISTAFLRVTQLPGS